MTTYKIKYEYSSNGETQTQDTVLERIISLPAKSWSRLSEISLEIGKFSTSSALFNQSRCVTD